MHDSVYTEEWLLIDLFNELYNSDATRISILLMKIIDDLFKSIQIQAHITRLWPYLDDSICVLQTKNLKTLNISSSNPYNVKFMKFQM